MEGLPVTGESDAVVSAPLEELPDILGVMEGSLVIETDDDGAVRTAIQGLRYLLAIEFAGNNQPSLCSTISICRSWAFGMEAALSISKSGQRSNGECER